MTPMLYRGVTTLALPLIECYLARRRATGHEDPARADERRGIAGLARPPGGLLWLHAASVGESLSALSLIERILDDHPGCHLLMTTGTVTSARLLAERLPPRAIHQYVPVDRPGWVRRFLDHWRPDLALWMESEFWPNLVGDSQARGIPMILVNARMSPKSFAGWRRWPGMIRPLLAGFAMLLAQDEDEAGRLRALGAPGVKVTGNLKFAARPLPVDEDALGHVRGACQGRPMWLAASTHPGEETIAGQVHRHLLPTHPGLLTVIAPRHPNRGSAIAQALADGGLTVARRSLDEPITPEVEIYVADTLGEFGLFYRLSPVAFIGGSLVPHGGQNVLEAARLGAAVIHGPHMGNFRAAIAQLGAAGGAIEIADAESLGDAVAGLLADPVARDRQVEAAKRVASDQDGVLDTVVAELAPYLAELDAGDGNARP